MKIIYRVQRAAALCSPPEGAGNQNEILVYLARPVIHGRKKRDYAE
jgi:hypothetical protein